MYKNNSGLIAKTKVSKYKKGLCLAEKLACENPLLLLYLIVSVNSAENFFNVPFFEYGGGCSVVRGMSAPCAA
jgi:hypothetical protein